MIYFETEENNILISATCSQQFLQLVAEELKDKPYRGDILVEENDVTAIVKIYGTIILKSKVF